CGRPADLGGGAGSVDCDGDSKLLLFAVAGAWSRLPCRPRLWLGPMCAGRDGRYECSCPAGHGGKRCEAVLRLKRSAAETSPCPCLNGDDCTNFSGDGSEPKTTTVSPCIPTQKLPSDGGCTGGKDVWGFVWPNAANDETVDVPCPDGQERASRVCINGVWKAAQVLECDSTGFVETLTKAEEVFREDSRDLNVRLNETAEIMRSLLQLIQPREGLSHLPGDLNSTNAIASGVLTLLEDLLVPGSNVTSVPNQRIFAVFNTALHPNNAQGWMTLQDAKGGASKFLDNMERYGLYLSLVAPDTESRTVHQDDNFVIGVIRHSAMLNASSVTFPESLDELENTSYSAITAQISIPSTLLLDRKAEGANTAPVAGSIAQGMETALLPTALGPTWSVASQVISAQVAQRRMRSSTPINVTFTFNSVTSASEFRCGYWNFSEQGSKGAWAFDGVEMVSMTSSDGSTVVTCKSLHLTSFAVLVNAGDGLSDLSEEELKALMVVSNIGCAISLACLFLAIIYYLTIWKEMFEKVNYFIHFNLAIALFLAYFLFVLAIQLARENEGACIFVAALLQYLFLSAFCWMMCEGIMLYLMLVVVFSTLSKKWWFFLLLGWVPALVPVVVGLATSHRQYGVKNSSGQLEYCWLSTNEGIIWAFIAPMLLIIIINSVFLVIALVRVLQARRRQALKKSSKVSVNLDLFKALFRATVVLLPMLGLTWVFGLFAVNQNTSWFAWLFTIFNTLQGCFIFIFHVVLSDKFWNNSHIKKMRRSVASSLRSSQFGSTVYSTIKRSSTVCSTFT
ncbi:Adhesion G protein-coupled receptor L3, partial [Geodia barretti]